MSNRRRARTYPPDVGAFIASARMLGYTRPDRVLARMADLLRYGFAAPDATDEMIVDELASHHVFGSPDQVAGLVAVGRLHLVGGDDDARRV